MAYSIRAVMLGMLLSLLFFCHSSNATSLPKGDCCTSKNIASVVKVLSRYPASGDQVCQRLLHRNAPGPVTTTKSTTVQAKVTATGTSVVTVKKGNALAVVTSTIVSTAVSSATSTLVSSTTVTITSTASATVVVTRAVTQDPPMVTVTTYSATYMQRRGKPTCLRDVYPGLPHEMQGIKLDEATQACECYFKSKPKSTVTVTKAVTARATVTIDPKSTTIPASTTTSVALATQYVTLTTTATITDYTTLTATFDLTLTETDAETTTIVPPVATDVVVATVNYELAYSSPGCIYNRFYSAPAVSGSPANNHREAFRQCQDYCTADPRCKFFALTHYDPAFNNSGDLYECDLDSEPYDSQMQQCNVPTDYFVGYNKL